MVDLTINNNNEDDELDNVNLDPQKNIVRDPDISSKPIEMNVPFSPIDHTIAQVPINPALAAFGYPSVEAPKKEIGYIEGSLANWEDKNETWRLAHGGWDRAEDYLDSYKDPNFNPLQFTDKFINIKTEYQPYLLASENEEQMNFRLKRIQHEQWLDDTVKNGSWMQWLTGGALAIPTDLISYIPVIGAVKYASMGKTATMAIARAIPGGAAFGTLGSLGKQTDLINGNMKDFLNDAVIRSVFATALFSVAGPAGLALDKLDLWKLQSYVGDAIKGVGYKLKLSEKGEVQGLHAYDMTPDGSVGADKVQLAQDKADSAFYKNGLFKIPYLGTATEKLMSNPLFGSTALSMLLSPYSTVRTVLDLAVDHGMITKGLAEGKEKAVPFFTQIQKTVAHIRQEQNIFNALHMERNGVNSTNYVAQNIRRAGMAARQKSLEMIDAEIGDRAYTSPEQFMEEIQQVMHSGEPHSEGAVNEAARMFKTSMDSYYKDFRIAFNLPEDWLPPITSAQYLMRVYDTNFLQKNLSGENGWISVISNELRNQDNSIIQNMQPIWDLEHEITAQKNAHDLLLKRSGITDNEIKISSDELEDTISRKKVLEERLQNEIRSNPNLHLLADNWHDLSADEAESLKLFLRPKDNAQKKVDEIKEIISHLQTNIGKSKAASLKGKTSATGQKHQAAKEVSEEVLIKAKQDLAEAKKELDIETKILYEMAHRGEINRRFFNIDPKTNKVTYKDPSERLKFRDVYHSVRAGGEHRYVSEEEAHGLREVHAKAYYDSIMNQTAEDTINQVMSRYTGNGAENHIKSRSINIPDQVLYDNNFMTKDLLSKVANYKMWLARRTHLKNTYKNVTIEGGFEPILGELQEQFDKVLVSLSEDKSKIQEKLSNKDLSAKEKNKLEEGLKQADYKINQNQKDFNRGKEQVQFAYEKMMAISKLSQKGKVITATIKAINVAANLGFLPVAMITDLAGNTLKQGVVPFIQAGVYPTIQSLFGLLKTHDSQSFRECFGALNLGLHHIGNTTASRQMDLATNPYLNLGRIPEFANKVAHFSSNINLTTTIDNYLQQVTSSVAQSNVIRHMTAFAEKRLTPADRMWLNKYGLNPEKDSEKILKAFKKDGGGTNRLGGYQSNFWHWEDTETANKVSDAVFRSTHDTIISANSLDAPIWLDENGLLGMMAPIIRGFKGWAFASLNRYLIPTLQQPDAQKLIGFALMTASAALVSPSRRMARGQSPYREGQTTAQIIAEILMDSSQFAWLSESLNDANLISNGALLRDLKNDKYFDRTMIGIMGPTFSNGNKLKNFVEAMATGNMNEKDTMGMASMIPIINSLYGYNASQHIIQSFGMPKYRGK